jgi:hypothetical protein
MEKAIDRLVESMWMEYSKVARKVQRLEEALEVAGIDKKLVSKVFEEIEKEEFARYRKLFPGEIEWEILEVDLEVPTPGRALLWVKTRFSYEERGKKREFVGKRCYKLARFQDGFQLKSC